MLLPPSVGANGRAYHWEVSARIDEVDFAPLPDWLYRIAVSAISKTDGSGSQAQSSSIWREIVCGGANEGRRNESVAKLAGYLLRHYVDPVVAAELILAWNQTKVSPPLPRAEIDQTVNSIAKIELQRRQRMEQNG